MGARVDAGTLELPSQAHQEVSQAPDQGEAEL